jgi:HlyD family secretion protein
MTATVSIITGEAKNVLRVPNGALRFTPTLPAEEIQKIMKEAGERMAARRQAESGQAPAGTAPASGAPAVTPSGGNGAAQGTRVRQPSRVWFQDESGKLRVSFIRPGVADTSYTEVLRGELKEGQTVILGLASSSPTGTTTQGTQRMIMMGPPPR